jgi:hypothetical protein
VHAVPVRTPPQQVATCSVSWVLHAGRGWHACCKRCNGARGATGTRAALQTTPPHTGDGAHAVARTAAVGEAGLVRNTCTRVSVAGCPRTNRTTPPHISMIARSVPAGNAAVRARTAEVMRAVRG